MAERPILFSGRLVRAILDGRKSQTRRPVKPQPGFEEHDDWRPRRWFVWRDRRGKKVQAVLGDPDTLDNARVALGFLGGDAVEMCPYGKVGDLLYVRETWAPTPSDWDRPIKLYRASWETLGVNPTTHADVFRWRPSIHMPKSHARIWLRVTAVRVERLVDIGEADAVAEGCSADGGPSHGPMDPVEYTGHSAEDEFAASWDSIYAKKDLGWGDNPWVWVIEFERVER